MLIDRSHRAWFWGSLAVFVLATAVYYAPIHGPAGPKGGTIPGLAFGTLALGLMIAAALLSARRQLPARRLGSAQTWLRAHIWLGLLSVPMVMFHSGFGWGGLLENLLWIIFAIVILSGVFGLALQQALPRMLTSRVPLETFIEQLPYLARRTQFLMDKAVSRLCGPLEIDDDPHVEICRRIVQFKSEDAESKSKYGEWPNALDEEDRRFFKKMALMAADEGRSLGWDNMRTAGDLPKELQVMYANLSDSNAKPESAKNKPAQISHANLGESCERLKAFYIKSLRPIIGKTLPPRKALPALSAARRQLSAERMELPSEFWPVIEKLQQACEEARQYAIERRLHRWLHAWLLVHVPLSMALFVLVLLHVVNALRVLPLGGKTVS